MSDADALKEIEYRMLLHYHKSQKLYNNWLNKPNKQLPYTQSPQQLIDQGKVDIVLEFVVKCLTDDNYEQLQSYPLKDITDL